MFPDYTGYSFQLAASGLLYGSSHTVVKLIHNVQMLYHRATSSSISMIWVEKSHRNISLTGFYKTILLQFGKVYS